MSNEEIDITGTLAKAKEGWQERTDKLAKPEFFIVKIDCTSELWDQLSEDERQRLKRKIDLVASYASYMSAGMVKGTVKYATDGYPLSQWMAHVIGEGADQSNYNILMFDAYNRYVKALDHEVDNHLADAMLRAVKEEKGEG